MHAAWGSWLIPLGNGVAMKVPSKNFLVDTQTEIKTSEYSWSHLHGNRSQQWTSRRGSRIQASSPTEIVQLFNWYFVSVFTSDPVTCNSADEVYTGPNADVMDLTLTVTRVLNVLVNLDTIKATSLDEILARILKETAYEIAPSLCLSDWASFPWTGNWPRWSLYSRKIIKNMLRTTGQFRYCARFLRW